MSPLRSTIAWAQRLGWHGLAALLIRRRLRRASGRAREALLYRLALSLDAMGRHAEAAACYAQAIDGVLAPLVETADRRPPDGWRASSPGRGAY